MKIVKIAAVVSILFLALPAAAQTAPLTDCDRLAGYSWLPRVPDAEGVKAEAMDAPAAATACEAAIIANPNEAFFHFLLARALTEMDASNRRALDELKLAEPANPAFYYQRRGFYQEKGLGGLDADEVAAMAEYARGCELETDGRVFACLSAGEIASKLAKSAEDHSIARGFLQKGCDNGTAGACRLMGVYYSDEKDPDLARDYVKAEGYFDKACKAGSMNACGAYGWLFAAEASTLPKNSDKALEFFGKACDNGSTRWCLDAGNLLRDEGMKSSYRVAEKWYAKGCDANDGRACYQIATLTADILAEFPLEEAEEKNAHEKYRTNIEKGCELKFDSACAALGSAFLNGSFGFPVNGKRGLELAVKGCADGRAKACLDASYALREPRAGLTKNEAEADRQLAAARTIREEECAKGSDWSCGDVVVLDMDSIPSGAPDLNLTSAQFDVLERACNDNHHEACNRYYIALTGRGDLMETPKGAMYYDKSLNLLERACNIRGGYFCSNLAGSLLFPPLELDQARQQEQREQAYVLLDAECQDGDKYACQTRDQEFTPQKQ